MQPGTKFLGTMWLKYTLGNPALLQNGTKEEHGDEAWNDTRLKVNKH